MNIFMLAGALATLAIPSIAVAAPDAKPAPQAGQEGTRNDGCCPDKQDGEKQCECCKGMKCCDKMKPADAGQATPAGGAGHPATH